MVRVTQNEENAKEIWQNSLNCVTFKMLQKSCVTPPTFGIDGGKDNLTTAVVIYGHVTEVPRESFVSLKTYKEKSSPPPPALVSRMALVTNLP